MTETVEFLQCLLPVARAYPTRRGYGWVAVGLIVAILAAEPLHRLTETLLGLLTA
jgi:hypothetical protein